jgi:hypothetical protein
MLKSGFDVASLTHASILGFVIEHRCAADGQAFAPSQICYQRLQNQFDRHFVGGVGAPLLARRMSSILRHCAIEPLSADRAPTVSPFACKQRVTPKVARTVDLSGRVAAALREKVPGVLHGRGGARRISWEACCVQEGLNQSVIGVCWICIARNLSHVTSTDALRRCWFSRSWRRPFALVALPLGRMRGTTVALS